MDNNYNNGQQPMDQQAMYQQQMGQPNFMKPRRGNGWIFGVITAVVMVAIVIGYAAWYLSGFGGDLEGKWYGNDATTIVFEEIDDKLNEATYMYYIYYENGELKEEGKCVKNEKTDELEFMLKIWSEYAQEYEYTVVRTAEIKRLTDNKLVFKAGKEKYTYERD